MADNEFFNEPKPTVETPTVETIKVGDKEYSQEELGKLVGLGQIAEESQNKYGRSIEQYWPEFSRRSDELKKAQTELEELKAFKERLTAPEVKVLSQEEQYAQAREQARQIGLTDEETTRRIYREERAAEKLVEEIDTLNDEAQISGKPKVEVKALTDYMLQEGFKSPTKAYRDMYEKELKEWETKKVNEIRPEGYATQSTTTAGAKEPVFETPKNADELKAQLNSFFNSSEGAENA